MTACGRPSLAGFNPHPALRPDAAPDDERHDDKAEGVSILIRPFDRMLHEVVLKQDVVFIVSILIRPFDRMLPAAAGVAKQRGTGRFNPHPALRPDAAKTGRDDSHDLDVSILIRPFDRMLLLLFLGIQHRGLGVSILIRPFDRMLQVEVRRGVVGRGFQSSSGPSTGCCSRTALTPAPPIVFQSSSGPSTGCCPGLDVGAKQVVRVSILIRPFDRMLHGTTLRQEAGLYVSILIRPFDRMLPPAARPRNTRWERFQSSSGPSTGCCCPPTGGLTGRRSSFNPHPALRPDAAAAGGPYRQPAFVSILIRPFDRMLRQYVSTCDIGDNVSILIRPFDRMLHHLGH